MDEPKRPETNTNMDIEALAKTFAEAMTDDPQRTLKAMEQALKTKLLGEMRESMLKTLAEREPGISATIEPETGLVICTSKAHPDRSCRLDPDEALLSTLEGGEVQLKTFIQKARTRIADLDREVWATDSWELLQTRLRAVLTAPVTDEEIRLSLREEAVETGAVVAPDARPITWPSDFRTLSWLIVVLEDGAARPKVLTAKVAETLGVPEEVIRAYALRNTRAKLGEWTRHRDPNTGVEFWYAKAQEAFVGSAAIATPWVLDRLPFPAERRWLSAPSTEFALAFEGPLRPEDDRLLVAKFAVVAGTMYMNASPEDAAAPLVFARRDWANYETVGIPMG